MSKALKIDFVLSDDEIQFLHSLANSNFDCYCSRSASLKLMNHDMSDVG